MPELDALIGELLHLRDCVQHSSDPFTKALDDVIERLPLYWRALERIAEHECAWSAASEPEAQVLAGIARITLGREHGLEGYALTLWNDTEPPDRCDHWAGGNRCVRRLGHESGKDGGGGHLFRCAGRWCPGLPWIASNTQHPTSCANEVLASQADRHLAEILNRGGVLE